MKRPDHESTASLDRVRKLRRESTPAERRLWSKLRDRQLAGRKFRHQVWLGHFVADFFCAADRLVIEVDGHEHGEREDYDAARTAKLERAGYRVIRFTNDEVMRNLEGVLAAIVEALDGPSPSHSAPPSGPLPLPLRERGL